MKIKLNIILFLIVLAYNLLQSQDFIKIDNNWYSPNFKTSKGFISVTQISNKSKEYSVTIDSIAIANQRFDLRVLPNKSTFTLKQNGSEYIGFTFSSKHNLKYNVRVYVYYTINELKTQAVYLYNLFPKFSYEDIFEELTSNKIGLELKNLLKKYLENHTALSYKEAREKMFGEIDNKDGWVECIYTGRKIQTAGIPDVNQTGFNTEHTWPQAFFNEGDTASRSDLFHIYPSDETTNNKRANYPFDYVSQTQWQNGNSKLGKNSKGETVFEPHDEIKGNIARSLFYFALRYNNPTNFLNSQEKTLREWSMLDIVDNTELTRNQKISDIQKKLNPFISHPEFLDRIYSISMDEDFPKIQKTSLSVKFAKVTSDYINSQKKLNVYITNSGNVNLIISKMELSHQNGGVISEIEGLTLPVEIPVDTTLTINNVLFNLPEAQNQNTVVKLTINNELSEYTIQEDNLNSVGELAKTSELFYINNKLIINSHHQIENIKIFDIMGREVTSTGLQDKDNRIDLFLNNGVYFILLQSGNSIESKKLVVMN